MGKIRILIADDHQIVRDGMEAMLSGIPDFEIVGSVGSGEEAINAARVNSPDVVLMDIRMTGMSGIEASRWIKENDDRIPVIIITMEANRDFVSAALKSGVDGYLPKDISKNDLVDAIRSVHKGEKYFNDTIKKLIFEDFYLADKMKNPRKVIPNQLTKRENQVLALVATGMSNQEVADQLAISPKTVETHKAHILIKLGLNNNSELIRYAVKNQIIST